MKAEERDALLIRLEERTANIWRQVAENGEHLKQLNKQVSDNKSGVAVNKRSINILFSLLGGGSVLILILKVVGVL